jgi:hypothetical protein
MMTPSLPVFGTSMVAVMVKEVLAVLTAELSGIWAAPL